MAQKESDREDLVREATALVERAELRIPGFPEPVVIGFRRDDSASFYFGADPVYQFNSSCELRRAYIAGLLYKADRGRLVSLTRKRSDSETILVRRELTLDESSALLASLHARFEHLQAVVESGRHTLIGQVPPGRDILGRIKVWLTTLAPLPPIANQPNVR